MIAYRIYTESKGNEIALRKILDFRFESYTLHYGIGVWEAVSEHSVVIEIITKKEYGEDVRLAAQEIKSKFDQDSVLITRHEVESELI